MSGTPLSVSGLPEAVAVLLRAVHDALDIPLPGLTDADEHAYAELLQRRSCDARAVLAGVLDSDHDIGPAAESLRSWTAGRPVTYTPWHYDGGAA
ncbi:hypothetical protein ACIOK4_39505 [Streptomyces bottropensis]|uniref:hypothetical protein n=1 Tax=Streptomyces bottropensis TaxID=42235 RepID=UPI003808AF54